MVAVIGLLQAHAADKKATKSAQELAFLTSRLSQQEEVTRRHLDAEEILHHYSKPLTGAAFDLQSRLYNILENNFLIYLSSSDERRKQALDSTMFRVAQYFAWSEALRQGIEFLDYPDHEQAREVSNHLDKVTRLWATDKHGQRLMIWSEAQRAIGELMLEERGQNLSVKGFAKFSAELDHFDPWLGDLKMALEDGSAEKSKRLVLLQHVLVELVGKLDPEEVRFSGHLELARTDRS